jgi:putative drug exporter of the RND superfamily
MFGRIAQLTARPVLVLGIAAGFIVTMMLLGNGVEDRLLNGGTEDPSSESAEATRIVDELFPGSRPNLALLVTRIDPAYPVEHPDTVADARALVDRLSQEPGVTGVTSYWTSSALALRSNDGRSALIVARIVGDENTVSQTFSRIAPAYRGEHGTVTVRLGGAAAIRTETEELVAADSARAELIVLPITLLILVLVFGSVVAALVPLALGIVTIISTSGVLRVLTEFTQVSIFAQNLAAALGLGLSIDYALLMVRRYREERERGLAKREAVVATVRSAGRTVAFSALTVAVTLSAMLVFPQYFLRSFAYAGISVVLFCAVAVLVLVPAALMLLGDRINAWDLRRLFRRRSRGPATGWQRLAELVMRRAPIFTVASVALLVALALPFLNVRFGPADHRQLPGSVESREVVDLVQANFPGRVDGAIDVLVAVTPSDPPDPRHIPFYAADLSEQDGVGAVVSPVGTFVDGRLFLPPTPVDTQRYAGGYMALSVIPAEEIAAVSPESLALVDQLRGLPDTLVTGGAATFQDAQDGIGSRLAIAFAIILVATLGLMFLFTGSVLVSLQTVLFNALSLTVMFGAVVLIFQEGYGSGLLGFEPLGDIETTLPVLMFCLTFGLSMDYNIIVLSRIREEYRRSGDHRSAVAVGLQRTGGLVTAAALVVAVVLLALGTSQITNLQMLGIGVALAVLMDATVVRCFLVPAVMALTGRAAWWAPGPLRRFHERFGLEEGVPAVAEDREGVPDVHPEPDRVGAGRPAHPA